MNLSTEERDLVLQAIEGAAVNWMLRGAHQMAQTLTALREKVAAQTREQAGGVPVRQVPARPLVWPEEAEQEDSFTMPIEQVRADLVARGIDTQPLKEFVHAKLAELRFGGERMEDRKPSGEPGWELVGHWDVVTGGHEWLAGMLKPGDYVRLYRRTSGQQGGDSE